MADFENDDFEYRLEPFRTAMFNRAAGDTEQDLALLIAQVEGERPQYRYAVGAAWEFHAVLPGGILFRREKERAGRGLSDVSDASAESDNRPWWKRIFG